MKFFRLGIAGLLMVAFSLWACAEEQGMTTGQTGQEQQQTETAPQQAQSPETAQPAGGEEIEIAGIVEQTADGFAVRAADESYQIKGEDLSQMVGKDVRISGTLQESEGERVISVQEITVLE